MRVLPRVEALGTIDGSMASIDGAAAKLINPRIVDPAVRAAIFEEANTELKELDAATGHYAAFPRGPAPEKLWKELEPLRDAWRAAADKVLQLQRKREQLVAQGEMSDDPRLLANESRSMEAFEALVQAHAPAKAALGKRVEHAHADAERVREGAEARVRSAARDLAIAVLVGKVVMVALAVEALSSAAVAGRLATRALPGTAPAPRRCRRAARIGRACRAGPRGASGARGSTWVRRAREVARTRLAPRPPAQRRPPQPARQVGIPGRPKPRVPGDASRQHPQPSSSRGAASAFLPEAGLLRWRSGCTADPT